MRTRWKMLIAGTMAIGLLLLIFVIPSPRWALRQGFAMSSGWLLEPTRPDDVRAVAALKKFVGHWFEYGLIADLHARIEQPVEGDDAKRIAYYLARVKLLMITQAELQHQPTDPPVLISGLGWCDSMNRVGAILLSREFSNAQITGLYVPEVQGGHSFGRVWSRQYNDWLYFDLWYDEIVVFRSQRGTRATYLAHARPLGIRPEPKTPGLATMRDRAFSGIVHNELQGSLGGYVLNRVTNLIRYGSTVPTHVAEQLTTMAQTNVYAPEVTNPVAQTKARSAYLDASLNHALGDDQRARQSYVRVLQQEAGGASLYGAGARIFIARIDR